MTPAEGNLFASIPDDLPDEVSDVLARTAGARVERIVSRGHVSSPDFWYEQEEDEFVLLVEGEAELEIRGRADPARLGRGDWIVLPAGLPHRVSWTATDQDTVWLAFFLSPDDDDTVS